MSRRRGSAYLLALTIALTFTLPLHITSNSSSLAEKDVGENLPTVMASPGFSLKTLTAEEISIYTGIEDPSLSSSCSMAVGDVNGDGEDDLVVALPPQRYNYNGEGAVHIIYSFVNSASSLPVNKTSHVVIVGNLSFRGIGRQIVVTDMDGDGLDDIIITAPDSNGRGGGRTQYGELFIVKGRREGLWGIVNVDDVTDYHLIGTSTALHFGRAIAVGDFNGDGKKDLAVSSDYINSTFGEMRRGAVFLIQGDEVWEGDRRVGRENINGSVDDELLGVSLAAGDFDGDGVDDLAISSKKVLVEDGRMDGGGVHLFKGGEYLFTSRMYSNKSNVTVYSDNKGDGLGAGLHMTDLDGDGKMELLMGSPGADLNGDDSGCVFVLKGGSTPSTTLNISAAQTDENIVGNDAGDMFGHTITVIDADGDGVNEILISAPGGAGEGNKRPFSGEIYSFTSSSLLSGENLSASDSSYVIQTRSYHLGIFLSSGYVEGKGVLLAVAPGGRPTEDMVNKSGHIMVLSLMGGEEKVIFGEVGSHFGSSVVFGDFNGDGRLDLAVGARYWSNTLSSNPAQHVSQCGGVFIFYNASELPPITDLRLESADVILSGTESSMLFGVSLDVGDLNGDGIDDLVIGAPHASSPPFSWQAGRVFILFGNHSLPSFATLPSGVWETMIYGQRAGDKFGYSLGVGDLDGDGIDDLAVGAPEADGPSDSRDQAGDVYLFFGRNSWPRQGWCNSLKNVSVWGAVSRERLSFGDIIIEDLNDDGYGEIVIGSSTASPLSIVQEGEVTIVWGMNRTDWGSFSSGYDLSTDPSVIIAGAFRGDLLGTAISVVELRGTVSVERALAIGAPGSDGLMRNTPNSGAVFMVALKDVLGKNGTYRVHRIASCVVEETTKNAYMGSSLLSTYLDSDSTLDLIIGAPGKDVVYLATTPYLPLNSTLQTDILPSLTPPGERFSLFGTSIAAGDVDGDGETDVVVGAPLSAVEGGVGGCVLVFPKAVANIPETRIHISPITGGVVENDGWGRIVLFPTESPYSLNITVYLPPALSSIIDGVDVIAHSKDGASWVNLSRYGNSHPGGEGGIKFLNTSTMTTGLASLDLCLNFTVPLTTDEPVRWFSIFLKNNTVGEVGLWRFPVRWYSCREIAALPPNNWSVGELTGGLPWIPGGMWISFEPIRFIYSPYGLELLSIPYTLSLSLPPTVSGEVSQNSFTVRIKAGADIKEFNATISFHPLYGGLPPIPDLVLTIKVDAVNPAPPRDFKIYPDGPEGGEGMYDPDGEIYIDFSEGWDPWGPSEGVSTFLSINFSSNHTPVREPFEVTPGTWVSLPQGEFTLSLYSVDTFLHHSEKVVMDVVVDPQPLTFTHLSPKTDWVNKKLINFTVEISSGPSGVLPGSVKLQISLPEENMSSEWLDAKMISSEEGVTKYSRVVSLPDGIGYSVRWMAYTGSGLGPYYSTLYFFSVDTAAPVLISSTPMIDQYVSGDVLTLTATFEDRLSMLNLSSAAFRVGPVEGIMSLPWMKLNIQGRNAEITLQGSVNITFVGPSAYQWRISDMAGNVYTLPPIPFTIDLTPPEFMNFSHPPGSVIEGDSVVVEIEIFDAGGVVPSSVEVAYSNPTTWTEMGVGIYGFGEWESVDEVRSLDPLSLRVRAKARIPLVPGEFNYVKFRVSDRAGNVVESNPYRLIATAPLVNHLPEVSIVFPIPYSTYKYGSEVTFSANATDPDGDNLTFKWYSNRSGYLGEGRNLVKRLESGLHEITLRVSDGKGVVEKRLNITVLPKPPEAETEIEGEKDVWQMLSENPGALLAILIPGILFGLFAGFLLTRWLPLEEGGVLEEEEGVSKEPSVLITPPPKKYYCIYCGGEVREGDEYCIHCGETFTEEDWEKMKKGKRRKEGRRKVKEWEEEVEEELIAVNEEEVEREDLSKFMREEEELEEIEEKEGEEETLEFEEVEEDYEEFEELDEEWEE